MSTRPSDVLRDMSRLPPVGTPERRQWDLTIREANELYPDWASINIGRARFRRDDYEKRYKNYYKGKKKFLWPVETP